MTFVRKIRTVVLTSVVLAILGVVSAVPAAAVNPITATDLNPGGAIVGESTEVQVFGIDLSGECGLLGDPCTLQTVTVTFNQVGGDSAFSLTDIGAGNAGLRVYKDTSRTGGNEDVIDPDDNLVSDGWTANGLTVTIDVNASVQSVPQGDYTFFLTVLTSNTIANGDDFTISLPSNAFDLNPTPIPAASFDGKTSSVIAVDTAPPAPLFSFVPSEVDGDVEWVFNEPVSGVDEENVIVREAESGTEVLGTVSYIGSARKAIFDPLGPLEEGIEYEAVVALADAAPITDAAGNVMEEFSRSFLIFPTTFTPAIVNGNQWQLDVDFDNTTDISFAYGKPSDAKVAGDWNGDGIFSPAVVRGNLWYFNNAFDGGADFSLAFGRSTDKKIVGDWDGDGVFTPGIVRGNLWYLSNDFDAVGEIIINYGRSTDKHVTGDWDGDGTYTPGIVRGNTWYLSNDFDGAADVPLFNMGRSTDVPLAADWIGDGISTPAVFRGGQWFVNTEFDNVAELNFIYGSSGVTPLVGDWDGGAA